MKNMTATCQTSTLVMAHNHHAITSTSEACMQQQKGHVFAAKGCPCTAVNTAHFGGRLDSQLQSCTNGGMGPFCSAAWWSLSLVCGAESCAEVRRVCSPGRRRRCCCRCCCVCRASGWCGWSARGGPVCGCQGEGAPSGVGGTAQGEGPKGWYAGSSCAACCGAPVACNRCCC